MKPYDFAEKSGVPAALLPEAAERLFLAEIERITAANKPTALAIIARVLLDDERKTVRTLKRAGIVRTAAASQTRRKGDPDRPCPRCGAPMHAITIAGGLRAAFCSVDKVTMPF